jgi:sterol desaturase/sphingolipid hydroxylase (fatty acid hydroxylase superfamily)
MTFERLLDRILYPALMAVPFTAYALLEGRVPAEFVPSLATLPLLLGAAALEVVYPYHDPWSVRPGQKHLLRDFASTLIMVPIVMRFCDAILRPIDFAAALWPRAWPVAAQLVLAILVAELAFYWIHRLSHHKKVLWRFHGVHHSITEVHWLNSGYLHVVDAFLNFFFYFMPLRFLGVPDDVFGWFLMTTMCTGTLEHANFRYDSGPIKYLFNTAELHRLHHSVHADVSQKNFGKITCLWDLVFGTFLMSDDRALILDTGSAPPRPKKVKKKRKRRLTVDSMEVALLEAEYAAAAGPDGVDAAGALSGAAPPATLAPAPPAPPR